jgi:hypothetical protein
VRIGEAGEDVFMLYAGVIGDNLCLGPAVGQQFDYEFDRESRAANDRLARRDPVQCADALPLSLVSVFHGEIRRYRGTAQQAQERPDCRPRRKIQHSPSVGPNGARVDPLPTLSSCGSWWSAELDASKKAKKPRSCRFKVFSEAECA